MGMYGDLVTAGGSLGTILTFVIIALFILGLITWFIIKKQYSNKRAIDEVRSVDTKIEDEKVENSSTASNNAEISKPKSVLNTGKYRCMAIRPGNIVDFTTIPKPIGNIYQFDTTCPMAGGGYLVRETDAGEVIDYDPRDINIDTKQTPAYAWFATHWEIVRQVFSVPVPWWKQTSTIFAVLIIVVDLVVAMAILG